MNGKAARNLRKLIQQELPDLPAVSYKEENKREKLFASGLDSQGKLTYTTVEVSTRVLSSCQRALYQRAKKLHSLYPGH